MKREVNQPGWMPPFSPLGALIAVIAGATCVWFHAWRFPAGNNAYHVPIALGYAQSAEGPHDGFHRSLENFISFFWVAVSTVATEDNIRALFLGLLVAACVATTLGAYALAHAGGAPRMLAAIGAGLLAFGFSTRQFMEFGNGELLSGFLTHSQFATALCLIALAFAVRGSWWWAALLCGAAANLNLFLGIWSTVAMLLLRVAIEWQASRSAPWRDGLLLGTLSAVAASPAVIWAFRTAGGGEPENFSFTEFLVLFEPVHSFVHVQLGPFTNFTLLPAVLGLSFLDVRAGRASARLILLAVTAALTVYAGALLPYLVDHRLVHSLYPLRFAAVAHWIAATAVVALWADAEEARHSRAFGGAIAVLGFLLSTPAVTLLGLLFLLDDSPTRTRRSVLVLVAIALSLTVTTFYDSGMGPPGINRLGNLPVVALVCAGGAAFIAVCDRRGWRERLLLTVLLWLVALTTLYAGRPIALALAAIVVLLGLTVMTELRTRVPTGLPFLLAIIGATALVGHALWRSDLHRLVLLTTAFAVSPLLATELARLPGRWRAPALSGAGLAILCIWGGWTAARLGFDFPRYPLGESWLDAQRWARTNTPPDTMFFSPDRGDFATLSRRPVWFDEKQGAAVMWQPSFFKEWNTRRLLASQVRTSEDLAALARSQGIEYLVLARQRLAAEPLPGSEVQYCNADFCILHVLTARSAP